MRNLFTSEQSILNVQCFEPSFMDLRHTRVSCGMNNIFRKTADSNQNEVGRAGCVERIGDGRLPKLAQKSI